MEKILALFLIVALLAAPPVLANEATQPAITGDYNNESVEDAAVTEKITPIPWEAPTTLPEFIGEAADLPSLPPLGVPQNPFMADNPFGHVHNDAWMSDVYDVAGPLGREPEVLSNTMAEARLNPESPVFQGMAMVDSQGRLVLTCHGVGEWSLVLVDPVSLEVLARKLMPTPPNLAKAVGTSYVYLDDRDQVVAMVYDPGKDLDAPDDDTNTIQVMKIVNSSGDFPFEFEVASEYDVTDHIPKGDNIAGLLPDWQGRIWFAVRGNATVGVLDPATGAVKILEKPLEGSITNTFAMDREAAYVDTTAKMYRIEAGPEGIPQVAWEEEYDNIGSRKDGQLSAGTGTSPTILGNGSYVAIADNADPMQVVVFRTEKELRPNEERKVCEVPVFENAEGGALENSLIGFGQSLIVYNNYKYNLDTVFETFESGQSEPGVARVDIDPDGTGGQLVWENDNITLTNAVQKMSNMTGLIYAVTRKYDTEGYEDPGLDVYYFSAIDFRTGEVVWERLLGTGFGYDSFSEVMIGPTGTAYLPQYGGLIAVRDTY